MNFAEIILPLNLKGTFTYKVPENLSLQAGMRVLVPFRGRKIYTGIVFSLHQNEPEAFVPKEIISTLDDSPILPEEQLKFWQWISEYYLCNLGEIYRFAFPSSLKLESETYLKMRPNVQVDFENLDVNEMYLIQALEVRQLISLSEIEAFIPKKDMVKTVNALIDLQYIEIDEKISEKYKARETAYIRIKENCLGNSTLIPILSQLDRAPKQKELFLALLSEQSQHPDKPIKKTNFLDHYNLANSHLKGLVEKGFIEEYLLEENRLKTYDGEIEEIESLSDVQKKASEEIDLAFAEGKNMLLHGVTSSGKTHIYLEKIEETVNSGKNVLFLLPEIALTKQMTSRLEKKYGSSLGFYHQKLTDFERVEVWKKIRSGTIKILIGTRNALLLPYKNLGLIIVDEEHDAAYRPKDVSPNFNAKDAAQILAQLYNSLLILGSATPSVESWYAAKKGKLAYVALTERFGNVALPTYELIDFKEAQDTKNTVGNFSNMLIEHLQAQMQNGKQSMVLHNRRGYANVVECENCGYVTYCSNCDVVMTYHKSSGEMKCHYCGQKAAKPDICPKCHSEKLNERGVGVEQIQEELQKIIPEAHIDRMDVDAMRKKFAYEKLYEKIESGETDIVVGTQMISKGLDFDSIELVAIPRADQMIYVQDFRAEERAYQLITQVAGRAGRKSGEGKVYIQTFNPNHSVFQLIKESDAEKLYDYLLQERKKFNYPPFTKLILIELKHRREDKVERASQFLGSLLRKYLPEECVFGPEKSPIGKINTFYQYQVMLKLPRGSKYALFKSFILQAFHEFAEVTAYQSIVVSTTVDF